jgi:hypothetical protein
MRIGEIVVAGDHFRGRVVPFDRAQRRMGDRAALG